MSRIAKLPITVPVNTDVVVKKQFITITGTKGRLKYNIHNLVKVILTNYHKLIFSVHQETANAWAQAGTTRSLLFSMIIGVTQGYQKKLLLSGVGYRVTLVKNVLHLSLGYSHIIKYIVPNGISVVVPSQNEIVLKSIDKRLIGQVAANLRKYRIPEPYKGKGIRYENEIIRIKEAKKK
ncbi:50S ribosomal protein L6 [Buchnera aphidicola (Thelaxes californica)]|uniref:50S ribosomal protein L6 n=1 Tax=Buchnera aphidicola (Thelaxes californica) TaxID=1315998 RepID=A0A4D6YFM1_9GAMM|nr:50S ribosomal protein L6 [Buchnera aphidicola]QCI26913.1 50S ribosomal protein L6 [Buchnera aphidicola (Thelaxes californica)]